MSKIRRVFISHTSEFTTYPDKRSFIDAAVAAVIRAGCMPCDMEYFTAQDTKPAEYCKKCVCECDVYVGVIGFRYGSPVRDRPDVSYTELEFEAATESRSIKRLIFLLDPGSTVPVGKFMDVKYGDRQEQFRKRLSDAGVTCRPFSDAHELEKLLYQALKEDEDEIWKSSLRHVQTDHGPSLINPDGMVKVSNGLFLYGAEKIREVIDYDYWIDKYPVTIKRYRPFVLADGYENGQYWTPEGWTWREKGGITSPIYWDETSDDQDDFPVIGVSYYEAEAFAKWEDKRLPTEEEWEKAARGTDGRKYPWGNNFKIRALLGFPWVG